MYNDNIVIPNIHIKGSLFIPSNSKAIIIFVHGSGSNRFSTRNNFLSNQFNEHGFATLLIDLLTDKEKEGDAVSKHIRFNIELLTQRLVSITRWVLNNQLTKHLLVGYFSSSTGTAAALNASLELNEVKAIVSRGGRTDLIEESILHKIVTPSLFLIGEKDDLVIKFTKRTYTELTGTNSKEISIIPKASHFFEEPGKMEEVSRIAIEWFTFHLLENEKPFVNNFKIKPTKTILSFFNPYFNFKLKFQIKFTDRNSAGHILANMLNKYKNKNNIVVVGIPRGGVIIADVIARKLSLQSFNIVLSKRLRNPFNFENTIGSIFQDGSVYLIPESKNFSCEYIQMEINRQRKELEKQISLFRVCDEMYNFKNKTIVLIDDGCYTGSTMMVTSKWLRSHKPYKIIAALPVISKYALHLLSGYVDKIEYIIKPRKFRSVEEYYEDFRQIPESKIIQLLDKRKYHFD